MTHTNNRIQRHWEETQEFIKKEWPKITDVELKKINGDFDKLVEYIIEFYNDFPKSVALARDKMTRFLNQMDEEHPERITLVS